MSTRSRSIVSPADDARTGSIGASSAERRPGRVCVRSPADGTTNGSSDVTPVGSAPAFDRSVSRTAAAVSSALVAIRPNTSSAVTPADDSGPSGKSPDAAVACGSAASNGTPAAVAGRGTAAAGGVARLPARRSENAAATAGPAGSADVGKPNAAAGNAADAGTAGAVVTAGSVAAAGVEDAVCSQAAFIEASPSDPVDRSWSARGQRDRPARRCRIDRSRRGDADKPENRRLGQTESFDAMRKRPIRPVHPRRP